MKTLLLIFLPMILFAQSKQISVMVGYKTGEVSTSYTTPRELIYGIALATVESEVAEKRANKRDINHHDFDSKYIPAVFGLIGGKFDNLSLTGKLGVAYLEQHINNKPESQKYYFATGIMIDYKLSDTFGIKGSYDSVSSLLLGVTFYIE